MLRITVKEQNAREVILTAIGWISGANVLYLKQEMEHWAEKNQRLILQLVDVRAIDDKGLALLRDWPGPQLILQGDSNFLQTLLAAEGLELRKLGF